MKNGETKLKKLKNIGVSKTYVLFSLYILGFLGFSFLFANMLSDKGKIIKDLETEKTQLTIDQKDLLSEKNRISSLGYIREQAIELGYVNSSYNFIQDSDSLALR